MKKYKSQMIHNSNHKVLFEVDKEIFGFKSLVIYVFLVETIRNLVDSYILIVVKNLKDQVPKMIMHMMLNSTRDFIADELVATLYSECNAGDLMKESADEVERKTEMIKIYNALKDAVKIVTDININTTGTSGKFSTPTEPQIFYQKSFYFCYIGRTSFCLHSFIAQFVVTKTCTLNLNPTWSDPVFSSELKCSFQHHHQ